MASQDIRTCMDYFPFELSLRKSIHRRDAEITEGSQRKKEEESENGERERENDYCLYSPTPIFYYYFFFSLRNLCDLCVSAVN
jgi:hypothetical protein